MTNRALVQAVGLERREACTAGAGLLIAMLAGVALARGAALFTQRAWLDEFHTLLVASVGGVFDSFRALAQGADFNPPLLSLLVRFLGLLVGGLDESGTSMLPLRILSFACVWLGLVTLYWILRRRFDRSVAFVSAFAVWTHPLVIQHSFEARFYGPWFLLALLFIAALLTADRRGGPRTHAFVAVAAIALCLIHYFGVITWGLIVLAFALNRRPWHDRGVRSTWLATLAGPVALAACLPMYVGQRNALSTPTWIAPATALTITLYLVLVFGRLLLMAGVIRILAPMLSPAEVMSRADSPEVRNDFGILALFALGLLPLALIAFSVAVQPSLIDRYTVVGILACAPVLAGSLARVPRSFRIVAGAALMILCVRELSRRARGVEDAERDRAGLVAALDAHVKPGEVVVVDDRFMLYPLARGAPAPVAPLVLAQLADSMRARNVEIVERDVARVHFRLYGFPELRPIEQLRTIPRFWLVTRDDSSDFAARRFPEHSVTRVAPHLRVLEAHVAPAS